MKKTRFPFWVWALVPTALSGQMLLPLTAWGQAITPDGTLPTQVMQDGDNYTIEGGGRAGGNLFHSFQEFSVPTGGEAYFDNAVDVDNIFSRVTGGNVSDIDGLIRANGSANLFLINPAGIVFGPNARLDIGGSFLGSTASGLLFPDGTEFSATNPSTPLLTINAPIGLQFREDPGEIKVQGQLPSLVEGLDSLSPASDISGIRIDERLIPIPPEAIIQPAVDSIKDSANLIQEISEISDVGLEIEPGKTLALVGGELALEGSKLRASRGRVELGSVGSNNQVSITPTERGWALGYEGVEKFKNVSISGLALVDVSGEGSGEVQVRGADVTLAQQGLIFGATEGNIDGGEISIGAENLNIQDNSLVSAIATEGSGGNSGNVILETESLKIENSLVLLIGLSKGNSGNLTINAETGSVELTGTLADGVLPGGLIAGTAGEGSGGILRIETRQLIARDGAGAYVTAGSVGNAGNVIVRVSESIELSGEAENFFSGLFANGFGSGAVGNLEIETGQLIVRDGATITATTRRGSGGNVSVTALESIEVIGTTRDGQFESNLASFVIGSQGSQEVGEELQAGDLQINARRLIVRDGAQISASAFGSGAGGTVEVTASESIELIGQSADGRFKSGLFAQASLFPEPLNNIDRATRVAGNLRISTGELIVRDGAEMTASREGLVGASSSGTGAAGNLTVNASEISLDNGTLRADTTAGQGNITLTAKGRIELRNDSTISTDAAGTATGGNIAISTDFLIAFPGNNDITANAERGQGGQVNITADGLFGINFRERPNPRTNDITASSLDGPQGEVRPIILNAEIIQGLVELSENVVNPNEIVAQACSPNRTGGSSLIETGRGGLPPTPYDPLTDDTIRVGGEVAPPRLADLPDPEQIVTKVERTEEITSDDIQPARGWFVNEKGNIVLTPYPTPNATGRHPGARPGCGPVGRQK